MKMMRNCSSFLLSSWVEEIFKMFASPRRMAKRKKKEFFVFSIFSVERYQKDQEKDENKQNAERPATVVGFVNTLLRSRIIHISTSSVRQFLIPSARLA